jgi:hypothetical protein
MDSVTIAFEPTSFDMVIFSDVYQTFGCVVSAHNV